MAQPRLYLFIGYPGAGKTTVAHLIHDATGAIHLWADHERQNMFSAVTHSKLESEQLYAALNLKTDTLLRDGHSVIFDTNFNYRRDRNYLRRIAAKHGAETVVIWMQTPVDIARERALHDHHRSRNKYEDTMTTEQFNDLICRLEAPSNDETFITIDGSNIDTEAVMRQLEL